MRAVLNRCLIGNSFLTSRRLLFGLSRLGSFCRKSLVGRTRPKKKRFSALPAQALVHCWLRSNKPMTSTTALTAAAPATTHRWSLEIYSDGILSYATRERLLASPAYAALKDALHLITCTADGRWTAVIIGAKHEENAAWHASARADGKRFFWVA